MKTNIIQFTDDINDEFLKIKNNLQTHLNDENSIKRKKMFLSSHVPKEVITTSEILLDTIINDLMDEARLQLKSATVELQNKFYDHDFRKIVKKGAVQIENKLSLEPEYVKYSSDPQLRYGLAAAGVTFITGAAITGIAFIPKKVIAAIISGIITLTISAVGFKFAYDKAEPQAFSEMMTDIESYLEVSKSQVTEWLGKIILSFDNEFKSFCNNNGREIQ